MRAVQAYNGTPLVYSIIWFMAALRQVRYFHWNSVNCTIFTQINDFNRYFLKINYQRSRKNVSACTPAVHADRSLKKSIMTLKCESPQ